MPGREQGASLAPTTDTTLIIAAIMGICDEQRHHILINSFVLSLQTG